jgi:hypothetical protein
MLSGLLFIELIAHYCADIYDADKRGLSLRKLLTHISASYTFVFPSAPRGKLPSSHNCAFGLLNQLGSLNLTLVGETPGDQPGSKRRLHVTVIFFFWSTNPRLDGGQVNSYV